MFLKIRLHFSAKKYIFTIMQVFSSPISKRLLILSFMVLSLNQFTANAQMLDDTSAVRLLRNGIGYIYNAQFDLANDVLVSLNEKYPGHPATYLFKGLFINWEDYPLLPFKPSRRNYESQLHTSIKLCEAEEGWEEDPESLLLSLCARSLLMLLYSENEMSSDLIPWVPGTYRGIRKAFEVDPVYADLYYFTGLYNYYREAYPEQHPIYKAVAFLFPHGDKEQGLVQLQKAAEQSIVLGPEAYSILSWICIQYENDFHRALAYSKITFDQYPGNPWFRAEYLKNLFLVKDYDEAEKIIEESEDEKNSYFTCQLAIFKGLLYEKKYKDYKLAEEYFSKGVRCLEYYGPRGKTFYEFGIDGLKRVQDIQEGKSHERKRRKRNRGFEGVNFDN